MNQLIWSEDLRFNIPEIDDQHQRLMRIINRLGFACDSGGSLTEKADILSELSIYMSKHFLLEESLMIEYDFPGFNEHKLAHSSFIKKIADYNLDFFTSRQVGYDELNEYILNWFRDHMEKLEIDFFNFYMSKQTNE